MTTHLRVCIGAHEALHDPGQPGALFAAAPTAQATLDALGTVHHANAAFLTLLQIDHNQACGRPFHQHLVRSSQRVWFDHVRGLFAGGAGGTVDLQVRAGDRTRWLRVSTAPLRDQHPAVAVINALDITDERQAQARLAASEQSFRDLVERSPDAMLVHRHGVVLYANRTAHGLLSPTRALAGVPVETLFHTDDHGHLQGRWQAARRGERAESTRVRLRTAQGASVPAEVVALSARFHGQPALVTVARDRRLQVELEERLAQADRLNNLGVLAACLAHEINNPLTYMQQNTEMVLDDLDQLRGDLDAGPECLGEVLARASEYLHDVREGQGRVADLVAEMKLLSSAPREPGAVQVAEVVEKAARIARRHLKHRATLELDLAPAPPVRAVEGRLFQVVLNLLVNAAQAIDEGDVASNRVSVQLRAEEDGWLTLAISDTGCGMDSHTLARIFDPFFTTKAERDGTGLGLAICQDVVQEMGGRITVDSAVGAGARFVVRLPANTPEQQAPVAGCQRHAPAEGLRVLLVEDDPGVRAALRRSLGRTQEVTEAPSSREAIALLDAGESFDLVLTDLLMADGSGPELHAWLLDHRPELAPRVAFMTGATLSREAREFAARAGRPLLEKPLTEADLNALLARVAQVIV